MIGNEEFKIKQEIERRTSDERCNLVIRRVCSILLSILILLVSACLILGAYIVRGFLGSNVDATNTTLNFILDLVPAFLIAIINLIIPIVLQCLVSFEKWDYNSQKVSQMMWRIYIARFFNIAIVYTLNITITILGHDPNNLFSTSYNFGLTFTCPAASSSTAEARSITSYFNCREDQAIMNFFLNLIVDFIVRKVIDLFSFCFSYCRKDANNPDNYKKPYDVADTAPDTLIFIVQIYFLIPFFPYITVLAPILLFLEAKFELYKLKNLKSKPVKSSLRDETAFFIMSLFNATMYLILAVFIVFFDYPVRHDYWTICSTNSSSTSTTTQSTTMKVCGPFTEGSKPADSMIKNISSTTFTQFLWYVVSSPIFLLCGFVVLIIFLFFSNESDDFVRYIKEKETENKNTITYLNEQLNKFKHQVQLLKTAQLREE